MERQCSLLLLSITKIIGLCVFGRRLYSADGRCDRQTQTADADVRITFGALKSRPGKTDFASLGFENLKTTILGGHAFPANTAH